MNKPITTIGRAEKVNFPLLGNSSVPARIDTGARTSTIWVSQILEDKGMLRVVFFGPGSTFYTGQPAEFSTYDIAVVSNSTGETQQRYKVRLLVELKGRKIRAWFTLADRSTQVYPVLIGRNVLLGKFIVDVKKGQVLKETEKNRTSELRSQLDRSEEKS